MDLTDTIAPNSDQLDAVDLLTGPRTFTITSVSKGNAEQPVNLHLAESDRPWRPGKSMRRVLVACWGADASQYIGRRVTLYCDPTVTFGGATVGGTRISHLSHLDKPKKVVLLVTRGKSAPFMVEPLVEQPPTTGGVTPDQLARLAQAMKDAGITTKDSWLEYLNGVIGRAVGGSKELTQGEAERVLDDLQPAADGVA